MNVCASSVRVWWLYIVDQIRACDHFSAHSTYACDISHLDSSSLVMLSQPGVTISQHSLGIANLRHWWDTIRLTVQSKHCHKQVDSLDTRDTINVQPSLPCETHYVYCECSCGIHISLHTLQHDKEGRGTDACNIYHINFKHPKAVLIAKVSPCASSTEKAVAVCMQIITTMALAKLYRTPDKYRT